MQKDKLKKTLINIAKIIISIALLYFVFNKIPFHDIGKIIYKINFIYFIFAAVFFLLSQLISAKRLQLFLNAKKFNLCFKSNLELYFLGMFYNFFIPGGIGGDAYKIYTLHKKFNWSVKKLGITLLNDRLSGLIVIIILIAVFSSFVATQFSVYFILFIIIIGLFSIIINKIFPDFKTIYFKALLLSFSIQVLQVLCFIFLLKSLGVQNHFFEYSVLFLASSVLSLISFAGIGVREMLFLQAATFLKFNAAFSVSASLLFTLITAIISFSGLFFQLRKLTLKLEETKLSSE